ncbi:hypothetical protein DFQ30_004203 [Apophysomyces sp. BC1015]|nr:hypothetical protein DFQ30_004203 [Apophysomyces sp. BC1015]KAG0180220.1 hypothetical protein DFQ29_001042 [Apophysomyces sp. BC1021]
MRTVCTLSLILLLATKTITGVAVASTVDTQKKEVPLKLKEFDYFHWTGKENAIALETFVADLDKPAVLQVTDFKNRGDMFRIYDNDNYLGQTSTVMPVEDDDTFASTPEDALMDNRFSKGLFELGRGAHRIVIKAKGPYDAGTAAIRLIRPRSHTYAEDNKKKDMEQPRWEDQSEENTRQYDPSKQHEAYRVGGEEQQYDYWQNPTMEYRDRPAAVDWDHPLDTAHTVTVMKTMWVIESQPTFLPAPIAQGYYMPQ